MHLLSVSLCHRRGACHTHMPYSMSCTRPPGARFRETGRRGKTDGHTDAVALDHVSHHVTITYTRRTSRVNPVGVARSPPGAGNAQRNEQHRPLHRASLRLLAARTRTRFLCHNHNHKVAYSYSLYILYFPSA